MHKRITFRHMDHSDNIQDHADKQLAKIERFLEKEDRTPYYIDLVLEPGKVHHHHRVELRVKSPDYDLVTHHEFNNEEFYQAMDRVIDTMYRELLEHKRKNVDLRKQQGRHEEVKKQK